MSRNMNRNMLLLLILGVGIGVLNIYLVPPFMNPDEIQHFMFAADNAYSGDRLGQLDREVLQLLKDYKWFHFIGVGPGWEAIAHIKDIYFLNFFSRKKQTVSRSYFHSLYGKILKYAGIEDPLTAFYLLRWVSFLLYLVILGCSFWFYRRYLPDWWELAALGQLLVVQAGSILNAVNYDVMLTLLGVLFFIFAHRFLVSGHRTDLAVMLVVAASATLVKTGGLLFFVYFFLLLPFKYRVRIRHVPVLAGALFGFIILFGWMNYLFPERFFKLYSAVFSKLGNLPAINAGPGFFNSILDSFYFHTGWMGFKLAAGWYWILNMFLLLGITGVVIGDGNDKVQDKLKDNLKPNLNSKWLHYSLLVFLLQLMFIMLYYGNLDMAQGRYLYPLMIPVITMIYGGLRQLETRFRFRRHYLLVAYILFQVIFFAFALVRMISVFYLEIASPHPGL